MPAGVERSRRRDRHAGLTLALLVLALSGLFLMTSRSGALESVPGTAPAVAAQAAIAASRTSAAPVARGAVPPAAEDVAAVPASAPVIDWDETSQGAWLSSLRAAVAQAGALERLAGPILAGRGPDGARVALLRVLYETRSPQADDCFDRALRTLPDVSTPRGESVPSFAIQFLGKHAGADAQARRILERATFDGDPPLSPGLRRRAAALLAQSAPAAELSALVARLANEADAELVNGAIAAISGNADAAGARAALARLGREHVPVLLDTGK